MTKIIQKFEDFVLKSMNLSISKLEKDLECDEYVGYNFNVNEFSIKFRKAKITPKKVGQFVTLWKRNTAKQTEPFDENDVFDYYIITAEDDSKLGFYIFPKSILIEKHILTSAKKEGKRGFRVYPNWVKPENKQAEKTQNWQQDYFVEIIDYKIDLKQVNSFFK
ncbi:MepB family protein [Empedobacter falsenii]|uniref:MepB family protein n=1 Tax=Empedobacter falsenii TaxID=343874 RepID=UPI002577344F|nr:MepB family protein [Empedobacter falsenii]MDM1298596.1 MepB family protein [Empedobacter falsenii]MDM1318389.1 MepB family protein [Empedobacter falsenii]